MSILARVSILLFLLAAPAAADPDPEVRLTTTQDQDGLFHTRGEVSLPYPTALVDRAMVNMNDYNVWAPRWQDGRDPASARQIFQLTGVEPHPPYTVLIYRIHLLWPFGSEGNRIALLTRFPSPESGVVRRIVFTQKDPSIAIDQLEGDFILLPQGAQGSLVRLECQVRLAWFLRPFFPLAFYQHYIVGRLQTALRSFAAYAHDQAQD